MTFSLAVAGKGGIGKTSLAALLIQGLIERANGPVLAVDADPNPSLGYALGHQVEKTISEMRNDLLDHIRKLSPGMTKDDYLELGIQECLSEGRGFDLLAMGAGEGPRCYCAINSVLRRCIDRLSNAYPYVVMDNEAGLEHLSRCTTQDIDVLLVVSNGHPASLQAAIRVRQLTEKLALRIGRRYLVLNDAVDSGDEAWCAEQAHLTGLELLGVVPTDEALHQCSRRGQALNVLPEDSPARLAAGTILEGALSGTAPELERAR